MLLGQVLGASRTDAGKTITLAPTIANIGVEGMMKIYATKYNVSLSVATRIIECESKFNPLALRLNKRQGIVWSEDTGYWQINDYYNGAALKKIGLDINNPDQNLQAGFYLLSKEGTTPWNWSKWCWNK